MSTIASFPRSRRDHAGDDAPGDEYGHRPCSRIGAQSITGSPWVALDTQHSSATLERAHLPRAKPGHPTPSRGAGKAFSRSPCPAEFRVQGPLSIRDPRSRVSDEADPKSLPGGTFSRYQQPPPVRHVKTTGILAAVAVTEPAAGNAGIRRHIRCTRLMRCGPGGAP